MDTTGHADGANAGFLRPDSVLVAFLLTDENDCSARDPEIFSPASSRYTGDLNVRCFAYPGALHPLTRYADGPVATRTDPRDFIFAAVVGVPVDRLPPGAASPDYRRILSDPRMVERTEPSMPNRLVSSCSVPGRGDAYPPRRIVRTAQEIDARGATAIVGSICQADRSDSMDAVLARITARLHESCSPAR